MFARGETTAAAEAEAEALVVGFIGFCSVLGVFFCCVEHDSRSRSNGGRGYMGRSREEQGGAGVMAGGRPKGVDMEGRKGKVEGQKNRKNESSNKEKRKKRKESHQKKRKQQQAAAGVIEWSGNGWRSNGWME